MCGTQVQIMSKRAWVPAVSGTTSSLRALLDSPEDAAFSQPVDLCVFARLPLGPPALTNLPGQKDSSLPSNEDSSQEDACYACKDDFIHELCVAGHRGV
ncbi:hypothetical protein H8959_004530 [Pygathrix nigripes]